MPATLYENDPTASLHRGAIYSFRPVFWLEPPLWVVRDINYSYPAYGNLYQSSTVGDCFRRKSEDNQEDVLARAKVRYVTVLSPKYENEDPRFKEVLVAPMYSVDASVQRGDFIQRLRASIFPDKFYLPHDPGFPAIAESYLDLRKIQTLDKRFLEQGKLDFCFSQETVKAILYNYKKYLFFGV